MSNQLNFNEIDSIVNDNSLNLDTNTNTNTDETDNLCWLIDYNYKQVKSFSLPFPFPSFLLGWRNKSNSILITTKKPFRSFGFKEFNPLYDRYVLKAMESETSSLSLRDICATKMSYAIPTTEVLNAINTFSNGKILEIGCGSMY
jgi:hypothetical protein